MTCVSLGAWNAQVRREVVQLESEYDSWRRQLDEKQAELKRLKADKTQRRRELRGNDQTSGPMAELMQTLGQLQKDIAAASAKALGMDEKLDEAKLSALHLEASEDELKQELDEVHALRVAEETKAQEMQAKIVQTQADLNARDEDLRRIKRSMEQYAGSLGSHQGDHFQGQEKLAKDMGDLETLSAVLPQLDEDIREGARHTVATTALSHFRELTVSCSVVCTVYCSGGNLAAAQQQPHRACARAGYLAADT